MYTYECGAVDKHRDGAVGACPIQSRPHEIDFTSPTKWTDTAAAALRYADVVLEQITVTMYTR